MVSQTLPSHNPRIYLNISNSKSLPCFTPHLEIFSVKLPHTYHIAQRLCFHRRCNTLTHSYCLKIDFKTYSKVVFQKCK